MFRFLLFLLISISFTQVGKKLLDRETFKAAVDFEFKSDSSVEAIKILAEWVNLESRSDLVHFLLAKAYLQRFLSFGDKQDLKKANESFEESISLFERNPETFYWWANLARVSARMDGGSSGYLKYIKRMRKACELDPNNYYYYSIYFESLIEFLRDFSYLRNPLPDQTLEEEIAFSIQNYMRLKSYYTSDYKKLLRAHFDEAKQRVILGHNSRVR